MNPLRKELDRLAGPIGFRALVIAAPTAAGCATLELVLAIDWAHRQEQLAFFMDMVPAVVAVLLLAAILYVLPLRAACEGRRISGISWAFLAAADFFATWAGSTIAGPMVAAHTAAPPTQTGMLVLMQRAVLALALLVDFGSIAVLVREMLRRCPPGETDPCAEREMELETGLRQEAELEEAARGTSDHTRS